MAKIVKTNKQEDALKAITANLKTLEAVNAELNTPDENGQIIYVFGGKKLAVPAVKAEKDKAVNAYRIKLADETRKLAKEYSIALDDADEKILNNGGK